MTAHRPHHRRRPRRLVRRAAAARARPQRRRARGHGARRRPLPLLSRRRARHDHRQRQSSAAVRQPRRARLICATSARADRLVGPAARANSPSSIWRAASAGRCASTTAACRGGSSTPSRRVPGTRALDYLPLARLLRAAPGQAGRRRHRLRRARSMSAWSSRCCSRRSTSIRREGSARLASRRHARDACRGRPRLPAADRPRRPWRDA